MIYILPQGLRALRGFLITLEILMASITTKLDAVNIVLSNIGQSPVINLISGNPIVEMAELVVDEISRTIQAEGWVFNTEYSYPFNLNEDGELILPTNVLQLDLPVLSPIFVQQRQGKLYDRTNHTYDLSPYASNGVLECDVTWLFDYEDIPEAIKNYLNIRAANVFAGRAVGSQEAVKFGQKEEVLARAGALDYETAQGDYSIFGDPQGLNMYRASRPRGAVYRF